MQRPIAFFSAAALVAVYAACAAKPIPFHQMRTPSGDFCSDMPIFTGLTEPDREFHRIGPVKSGPKLNSPAERLESLRRAACEAGADAIVEAAEAEERQLDATHSLIASGTGVIWTRRPDTEARPLGLGAVRKQDGEPKEPPPPATAKEPTPLNTAGEIKSPPPPVATAEPTPTATATATTAPATTTTTKTTTKTKTKPK